MAAARRAGRSEGVAAPASTAASDPLPRFPCEYATCTEHAEIGLSDLLHIDSDEFRRRFRRTPLWRCHPEGLRRNALTVAGAAGHDDLLEEVVRVADVDADAEVRRVADWTRHRLQRRLSEGDSER